jgi:predicted aldo/keto reductase-like oxidoreductase
MEYRRLGRTNLDVSIIGLGTEHYERSRETMDAILGTAAEAGVNYADAVYTSPDIDAGYWDNFGPALQPYRDKFVLVAHWGPSDRFEPEEAGRHFEQVLELLGGYAEIAMLTVVDSEETWNEWGQRSLKLLRPLQEQGRIGHIGLSGHNVTVATTTVNSGLIDVVMVPLNLLPHDEAAVNSLFQACAAQDVGLVAMKPYHGGALFFREGEPTGITPTHCLAYVFSLPISTAIPGVKNVKELRTTLHYLEASDIEKDYPAIVASIHDRLAGQCVYCHHCLPCPQEIQIGWMIWLLDFARGGVTEDLQNWYASHCVTASACTECGECLPRCPYGVEIIDKLRQAAEIYETGTV